MVCLWWDWCSPSVFRPSGGVDFSPCALAPAPVVTFVTVVVVAFCGSGGRYFSRFGLLSWSFRCRVRRGGWRIGVGDVNAAGHEVFAIGRVHRDNRHIGEFLSDTLVSAGHSDSGYFTAV